LDDDVIHAVPLRLGAKRQQLSRRHSPPPSPRRAALAGYHARYWWCCQNFPSFDHHSARWIAPPPVRSHRVQQSPSCPAGRMHTPFGPGLQKACGMPHCSPMVAPSVRAGGSRLPPSNRPSHQCVHDTRQPSAEEAAAEGKAADSDSRNDGGLLREDVRRAAGSEREWQRKFLDVVCLHRSLLGAGSPAETPSFASPYAAAIRHWTLCSSDALAGVYCVVSLFIFASAATLARLEKGEAMSRDLARCAYHSTGQSQANPPQPSISNSKSWPSMASTPPMASNACIVGRVSPCPTTSRPSTSNSTCVIEPMTTASLSVPRMVVSPVGGRRGEGGELTSGARPGGRARRRSRRRRRAPRPLPPRTRQRRPGPGAPDSPAPRPRPPARPAARPARSRLRTARPSSSWGDSREGGPLRRRG